MRNVVFALALLGACGPHPNDPQTTESDNTTSTGHVTDGQVTDGATATSTDASTGTPDTDDPVITTLPTTTTGDPPPDCAVPVMCGETPCIGEDNAPICAPEACEPMRCEDCPDAPFCGNVEGVDVCVIADEVPCKLCTSLLCEQCPNNLCELANFDLCLDSRTGLPACVQDLMFCPELNVECVTDAECGGGAPTCVNSVCRATCETTDDCGLKSPCLDGVCVDAENHPVCAVIPHQPAFPTCEPLGSCMNDLDCPVGAATCWDLLEGGPVIAGVAGQCVSACTVPEECVTGSCSDKGFCADENGLPICTQP